MAKSRKEIYVRHLQHDGLPCGAPKIQHTVVAEATFTAAAIIWDTPKLPRRLGSES